ncbi:MAG TPA: hypothetical protein H9733_04920 [Candidatus Anaerotignum merdipullorum]|nr:hypothetical protein [Candidatus Anaerotignum merdipullorum]
MKSWVIVLLVIANVIGWIGCLKYYVGTVAILRYIQIKNYTLPSQQEIKECSKHAIERIFKINQ